MPDKAARFRFDKFKFGDEELGLESAVGIGAAGDAFTCAGKLSSDFGVILKFVEVGSDVGGAGASFGCLHGGPVSGCPWIFDALS